MRLFLALAFVIGLSVPAVAQDKPAAKDPPPAAEKAPAETKDAPPPGTTKAAKAKPEVTRYGDWFVGCQKVSADGKAVKVCEMQQILEETQSGQAFIRITVIYPRNSKKPILRIFTPLGVVLQKGLVMQIDGGKPITLPFSICIGKPPACIIDGLMENSIVTAMKRGNGGTLTLSFGSKQTIKAPFSLAGFTKAIGAIKPK